MREVVIEPPSELILLNKINYSGNSVIAYRAETGAVCVLVKSPVANSWFFKSLTTPLQNNGSFQDFNPLESTKKAVLGGRKVYVLESQEELAKFILDEKT